MIRKERLAECRAWARQLTTWRAPARLFPKPGDIVVAALLQERMALLLSWGEIARAKLDKIAYFIRHATNGPWRSQAALKDARRGDEQQ